MLHRAFARVFFFAATAAGLSAEATIRWLTETSPVAVVVDEVARGSATLQMFAEQAHAGAVLPMAGQMSETPGQLRFEPLFPLTRGVRYRAEFRAPGMPAVISYFSLPADTTPSTTVVKAIFPSAEVLPENQLKFYVHFSAPMSRGETYQHVRLRDAAGKVIELPFLELAEELWEPAMTRLTVLIDPGRIKRGVKPLEDIGPVFEAGKNYTLEIDAGCLDAAGRPLRTAFAKKFRIGTADRTPPDHTQWKLSAPVAATHDALVVEFDEPMEHALALRLLNVVTAQGRALEGAETLENNERRWRFTPEKPWKAGAYRLVIGTTIEDLAGNNIGKKFDVDVFEKVERRIETPTVERAFVVK